MIYGVLIWNVIVMLIYGADKLAAKAGAWRISEAALLTLAFCMGGAGALLGMIFFRHKTSKPKFKILVPLAFVFNIILTLQIKKVSL